MKTLKLNSQDPLVSSLQEFLKIKIDGYFGPQTQKAVKQFQIYNKLFPDGIVGKNTYIKLFDKGFMKENLQEIERFEIDFHRLPKDAYFPPVQQKKWIFLHHTNGWHNPHKVIDQWGAKSERKVATEFVIGGQSIKNDDNLFDGKILQSMPDKSWAWHIGVGNNSLHRESIGIEMCSFGNLTKGHYLKKVNGKMTRISPHPDKFYTSYGQEVHSNQVCILKEPFRGFTYWHKYSEKQLASLKNLLEYFAYTYNIDIKAGLPTEIKKYGLKAFDKVDVNLCRRTPGLWSHTNVDAGKFDVHPQQKLLELLTNL